MATNLTHRICFSPAGLAVFCSIIDVWLGFCNEINPQLQLTWKMFCFLAAQLPADWKHNPAMADARRTTTAPGALRSTPTPRRSRHVHVWDGLQPEAVPPPGGHGPAWGWSCLTTLSGQCKLRTRPNPPESPSQEEITMPGLRLVLVFHSDIYKDGWCICFPL